jgi:biopolymer transport protein ExbD
MAGGGPVAGPKKKKPTEGEDFIRHPKSRVSIYIDMTPMVDVAMLLLIFFMVTTVFRNPQAMELQLPDTPDKVEVPESNVMTLAVRDDGNMYERVAREPWRQIKVDEIKPTIEGLVAQRPQIIALIKVSPAAPYHHVVDIMDELNLAKFNRLSILRLEDPDLREVQVLP